VGRWGETTWQNRGGHRLWVAPETPVSKSLDNGPIEVKKAACCDSLGLAIRQPVESESGLEKELEIRLAPKGTGVTILHRVTNRNQAAVRLAPWGITVMRPGGIAVAGFPPRLRHDERLMPTNPLVMWGYTDFSDPRWRFTRRFVLLRQDRCAATPQKAGLFAEDAWVGYAVEGDLFLKRARAARDLEYPDFGCSVEMFTNSAMLEVETLGPIESVKPGSAVEHIEEWSLHQAPALDEATDEQLEAIFHPILTAV
jgi:hypothetical protein